MKKIFSFAAALVMAIAAHADGGMWWLQLMEQQHLADSLKRAGLKMKPAELQRLRSCVGQFGGGCTAEVISPDGLILTNNHCGYSFVHAMSTLEVNYLQDGYFAKSRAEELEVPGLTFTFVLDVRDVTESVEQKAKEIGIDEYEMQSRSFLATQAQELYQNGEYAGQEDVEASIVPFYGGNQFYLILTRAYKDVRLVANPPLNVAQFGGDSDNWVWPRHNPDFAVFRIYADAEGHPAEYSENNVPLHCDNYLPISLRGYKEGDFTMIMGFPGRTNRYLSAAQLQTEMQATYQSIVTAGEPQLEWERNLMDNNDSIRLAMQDDHMSLQNTVKNFGGALKAVERVRLVDERRGVDEALTQYGLQNGNSDYATVVSRLNRLCTAYTDTIHDFYLFMRTLGQDLSTLQAGMMVENYATALEKNDSSMIAEASVMLQSAQNSVEEFLADPQRRGLAELLEPVWKKNCRLSESRDMEVATVQEMATKSVLRSEEALAEALASENVADILLADPVVRSYKAIRGTIFGTYRNAYVAYDEQNDRLSRTYQRGLMDMNGWTTPPDANFTQRLTYGHVKAYSPRDAVEYGYRTFLDGMFEKEDKSNPDYEVNPQLRSLYEQRQFAGYANKEGRMQTDFLTDNDITGGNSGSPVLNANGEIIGVAFDGNIESLSSDFKYNPQLQRCINADIRYVLWTLDTFGGSSYLLQELDIRK